MSLLNKIQSKKNDLWIPAAFYLAGGLLTLFLLNVIISWIGQDLRLLPDINFIGIGDTIAMAGVLALYPKLSAKAPRISLAGAVFLAVTVTGFFVKQILVLGNNLFVFSGFFLPGSFIWDSFIWGSFIFSTAGYLLSGIAALRTDHFPNLLAFAMLSMAAITSILITIYIIRGLGGLPGWFNLTIVSCYALVYLSMGYILKNKDQIPSTNILPT